LSIFKFKIAGLLPNWTLNMYVTGELSEEATKSLVPSGEN
jgi:hypothetical protein